jgi:2'-5' RNA ligase
MSRLFIAIDIPEDATAELVRIQPVSTVGVRLTEPGQMHLTLHYIGEADAVRTAEALRTVAVLRFSLTFEGVGQFPSAGGAVTLWAGVRESPELLRLHAATALALAGVGFQPEARRYTPHVTLARCEPGVADGAVAEFLARRAAFSLPGVPVEGFGQYSSAFAGDVPVYRRERSYPLLPTEGTTRT